MNATNFEVVVEKYAYVPSNSSEKKGGSYGWKGAGYYPDALVPLDKIISKNENNILIDNNLMMITSQIISNFLGIF